MPAALDIPNRRPVKRAPPALARTFKVIHYLLLAHLSDGGPLHKPDGAAW